MEQAVLSLENKMLQTDTKMDELALQVGNIQQEIFADDQVEVFTLLQSVTEVKNNYQNLRREISEVQEIQKQLSSSLQLQVRSMQSKFNMLKEKITVGNAHHDVPHNHDTSQSQLMDSLPNLLLDVLPDSASLAAATKQHHHQQCSSSSSTSLSGFEDFQFDCYAPRK